MLFSVADYQTRFGAGDDQAEQIAQLAVAVSAAAQRFCGRVLEYDGTETSEIHDAEDQPRIMVRRPPILSLTGLYLDTARAFDASSLVGSSDYSIIDPGDRMHSGTVELLSSAWPFASEATSFGLGRQIVKVVYRGGFDDIPPDLKEAAMLWAFHMVGKTPGATTETIGAYSVSYEQAIRALPREVSGLLGPFIRKSTGRRI